MSRQMAAFLREILIFDLDRGHASDFIAADGLTHIDQAAIARIGIGDQRRLRTAGDASRTRHHVGIGRNPRVGQPQM